MDIVWSVGEMGPTFRLDSYAWAEIIIEKNVNEEKR